MLLPEDFGLSAIQTLAHVGRTAPSWRHGAFWNAWDKAVAGIAPGIRPITAASTDNTDPTASHQFESLRHVRIGALLVEPPHGTPVRAGVVAMHGDGRIGPLAGERERWEWLASRGVATLAIRVRGFPGSALDTGCVSDAPAGWICHGLEALIAAEDAPPSTQVTMWIVPEAIADVVNAARALARWMGGGQPVYLHGESLGGGLAVLAAARTARQGTFARLAIGHPTLGDWLWRLQQKGAIAAGTGSHIRELFANHQEHAEKFVDSLLLADSVVHATSVCIPTLCKLAHRDDVVPAPSAAAVYNALACAPGEKWRFITPYGHFDGGIRNARRHAIFDRAVDAFLDPSRPAHEGIGPFMDVLETGDRAPDDPARGEPGARRTQEAAQPSLFGGGAKPEAPAADPIAPSAGATEDGQLSLERILCQAYKLAGRTLDDLPYTPQFEEIMAAARGNFPDLSDREAFHKLHNIRKAGRLPRLGRSPGTKPAVPPDDERLLTELIQSTVGTTGQRDQLPYTPAFDRMVWEFNQRTGRSLAPHELWRLVATLSK
ncbi:MAG: acetylxylan esterase [Phycisphaerales bacterium]|nr:acetylxylan esterase [Phycisphaerales bacterium]